MYNWKLGTQPATEGRTAGSAGRNGFQAANHVVFQGKWHGQQQEERAIPVEEEGQSWERTDRGRERKQYQIKGGRLIISRIPRSRIGGKV